MTSKKSADSMSATDLDLLPRRQGLDATSRGVLAMVLGMGFQIANDTVIKLASAHVPIHQIMALRGPLSIVLALAAVFVFGQRRRLGLVTHPLVLLRSALEAVCCLIYITALSGLGLAEFTSIIQATPLLITGLAVLLGWQSVGWRRWMAIGIGFFGVLLVAKPSAAGVNGYAALALLAAFIMAVRDLVTRRIPDEAPSMVVTLGATITVTALGAALGATHPATWVMPTALEAGYIAFAAVLVVACNMTIVLAFRLGDMGVVGPFRYSVILGSLILGYAVWGDRPDALALFGAALIVASGLYALRRDKPRKLATPDVAPL
jgi:drug/metabolite transporter (DMT)-like permease